MAEPTPVLVGSTGVPAASRSRRALRLFVRAVVVASVVAAIVDLARRFDAADVSLEVGWLTVALLPALSGVFVQALGWRSLLGRLTGRELPRLEASVIYLDAQMARYTPGKVGLLAVRVAAAPRLGISARLMVASLLVELLSWAGVGVLLGSSVVALALARLPLPVKSTLGPELAAGMATLSLLALLGLLALCSLSRARFPAWVRRVLAAPELDETVDRPFVPAALPLWHAVHWLCWVLAGGILALGVGASWDEALLSGGVLCLAVVLGFLAVVAPAGAGVREVVISVGTAPVLGPSAALVLGLTARVVSLVADLGCWATLRLLVLRSRK